MKTEPAAIKKIAFEKRPVTKFSIEKQISIDLTANIRDSKLSAISRQSSTAELISPYISKKGSGGLFGLVHNSS